jgi:hypothetical protein
MPKFITSREEVFDFLVNVMGDMLGQPTGLSAVDAGHEETKP